MLWHKFTLATLLYKFHEDSLSKVTLSAPTFNQLLILAVVWPDQDFLGLEHVEEASSGRHLALLAHRTAQFDTYFKTFLYICNFERALWTSFNQCRVYLSLSLHKLNLNNKKKDAIYI